jgi:hypothetical protein
MYAEDRGIQRKSARFEFRELRGMPDSVSNCAEHFRSNSLAWIALRHFLTAPLLRDLSTIIIEEVGNKAFDLHHLFDELVVSDDKGIGSWVVKPLKTTSPMEAYLQHRIRAFVWESDQDVYYERVESAPDRISSKAVEDSIKVGTADLATAPQLLHGLNFPKGESINILLEGFRILTSWQFPSRAGTLPDAILKTCEPLEMPLAAVAIKHFGDVCADADEWTAALELYRLVSARLSDFADPAWAQYRLLLQQITQQSVAAAVRTTIGPTASSEVLSAALESLATSSAPVLSLNASHDAFVASVLGAEGVHSAADLRAAILLPPLILKSHDLSVALQTWTAKEYSQASRHFWELLRRQIALGAASESRDTKGYYAACILDDVANVEDSHGSPTLFWMAVRLLIESGQSKLAEGISWRDALIKTYVDKSLVDQVASHTMRYPGAVLERLRVAVELFKGWLKVISPDKVDVATAMLSFLARIAKTWPASFMSTKNVGGRSLEVIGLLARERPEFRSSVSKDVTDAVIAKFKEEGFWTGKSEALKTACDYLDALTPTDLSNLIEAVLSLLDGIDPTKEFWPIVRSSIDVLISEESKRFVEGNSPLRERIVSTVMRFGIQQQTEHAHLLVYFHDFDLTTITDVNTLKGLKDVVDDVRKHANQINASNAIYCINALLFAPKLSGSSGVLDALEAVTRILRSAAEGRPSMSVAHAYEPLRILADRQKEIATDSALSYTEFRAKLKDLLPLVEAVWCLSERSPEIFASLAIPPSTKPNKIIVHNWAFSSIAFAQALDERPRMMTTLDSAAKVPALAEGIALAQATRLAAGDPESLDADKIRAENRDIFYGAIGSRLVALQSMNATSRKEKVQALLDQCLKLGPRGVDAAVFLLASQTGANAMLATEYSNYEKRLSNDRDLRLAISPTLHALRKSGGQA